MSCSTRNRMDTESAALRISEKDNVAVSLTELGAGDVLQVGGVELLARENIPRGHKIALKRIEKGGDIVKYGLPIGRATGVILSGQHVHTHNLTPKPSGMAGLYEFLPRAETTASPTELPTFRGYRRINGRVGIRNELWVLPLVGCVNGVGEQIVRRFLEETDATETVSVLRHEYGCSQPGGGHDDTRRLLQALAVHPNAGGVLVLSPGCENNTLESFGESLPAHDGSRIRLLTARSAADEVEAGARLLSELRENMRADVRADVPLSELRVGLKCGGSDGLSGITANPLIGRFTDFLAAAGGTAAWTGLPEMFGAETLLLERAGSREVFDGIAGLVDGFNRSFTENGRTVDENLSPGDREGGITTWKEKSLGCTQIAGRTAITDVLDYGEIMRKKGLSLLRAPGNDLVSATALAAAGCQLILFSMGRGTPVGTVVPTVKISSNSVLAWAKPDWIDFDAGVLAGCADMDEQAKALTRRVLEIAGGRPAKNETSGFREIAIRENRAAL